MQTLRNLLNLVIVSVVLLNVSASGSDELMLCDFETPDSLKLIEARQSVQLVSEHATQGVKSGKVPPGFKIYSNAGAGFPSDWSSYDQLHLDIYNPGDPCALSLWIADTAGNDYLQRHNNMMMLKTGPNTLTIPVGGLYRGEKGSGKFLDSHAIQQLLIILPSQVADGFFLDNFRLIKGTGNGNVKTTVLLSFEDAQHEGAKWHIEDWPEDKPGKSKTTVVDEHVTDGKKALKVDFRAEGSGLHIDNLAISDWSGFDTLEIDCFNTSEGLSTVEGWFADDESVKTDNAYQKRHNYQSNLAAGASTLRFSVGGLWRGEKGSGSYLDPKTMKAFCICTNNSSIIFDNVRLVKGTNEIVVPGMKKFNFGPAISPTFPGFTKVQKDTAYNAQQGFGWLGSMPFDAREYEHPDSLVGHFVRCNNGDTFAVDLPNGDYGVYAILDCTQYYEYIGFHTRSIEAQGKVVVNETVTPEQFLKDFVFLHQDDEDLPGTDIWERYIQTHFRPKTFVAHVNDGQLKITFKGDTWGLTLSTLVIYPSASVDSAKRWLGQLEQRRRDEFNTNFVEVVRKPDPKPELSPAEQSAGYVLFSRELNQEISYSSAPGAVTSDTRDPKIAWLATPGEYTSGNFAIYPLKDCGKLSISATDLTGPNGKIPASAVRTRVIRYKMKRIGGRITSAYQYCPWLLCDFTDVPIPAKITRRFWITCKVPDGTPAGTYTGGLSVTIAGSTRTIPISLEVLPLKLDEPTMSIGMYGGTYLTAGGNLDEVLLDQKEHGMTAIMPSAPPLDQIQNGKAIFSFAQTDKEMEMIKKLGFHLPCFTYARMFNVREGDMEAECQRNYHMNLESAIKTAYEELAAHAKEKNWLPMAWALADEPLIHGISPESVIKVFNAHRHAAPQMSFVSEDAMADPAHWAVIPSIDIVSANSPRYEVAKAVKKAGSKYWFNNIANDRLSFGWFMWKAHEKMNVEALFQWGYSTNAGDIYYDLDGSEGDSGVSFTSSHGERPRREWELDREGMNDHRYLQTLHNLIQKANATGPKEAKAKAAEATAFIESVMEKIDLEKKSSPYSNNDLDAIKRKLADYILQIGSVKP
jgi:hypothetical protein